MMEYFIAELIVNRILLGPLEEEMQLTVPKASKLNSITIKEGICYWILMKNS